MNTKNEQIEFRHRCCNAIHRIGLSFDGKIKIFDHDKASIKRWLLLSEMNSTDEEVVCSCVCFLKAWKDRNTAGTLSVVKRHNEPFLACVLRLCRLHANSHTVALKTRHMRRLYRQAIETFGKLQSALNGSDVTTPEQKLEKVRNWAKILATHFSEILCEAVLRDIICTFDIFIKNVAEECRENISLNKTKTAITVRYPCLVSFIGGIKTPCESKCFSLDNPQELEKAVALSALVWSIYEVEKKISTSSRCTEPLPLVFDQKSFIRNHLYFKKKRGETFDAAYERDFSDVARHLFLFFSQETPLHVTYGKLVKFKSYEDAFKSYEEAFYSITRSSGRKMFKEQRDRIRNLLSNWERLREDERKARTFNRRLTLMFHALVERVRKFQEETVADFLKMEEFLKNLT